MTFDLLQVVGVNLPWLGTGGTGLPFTEVEIQEGQSSFDWESFSGCSDVPRGEAGLAVHRTILIHLQQKNIVFKNNIWKV